MRASVPEYCATLTQITARSADRHKLKLAQRLGRNRDKISLSGTVKDQLVKLGGTGDFNNPGGVQARLSVGTSQGILQVIRQILDGTTLLSLCNA